MDFEIGLFFGMIVGVILTIILEWCWDNDNS